MQHLPDLLEEEQYPISDDQSSLYSSDSDYDHDIPLQIGEADPVFEKLSNLVISEKIPRSGILYLHLKDVVESFDDPINHQYNPHVIQALNTIAYIGGESVANLFVGPKSYGQGLNGKGHFRTIKGNFYGPSKSTRLKHQAGYTTKSGIYCPLLKSFLILCANTDGSMPFYRSNHVKVYATVVENDGTALKAGLRFDERLKTIVGLEETIIDHQCISS